MATPISTTHDRFAMHQSADRQRPTQTSPVTVARLAGLFFLLTIVAGMVAQMVIGGRLIIPGDPAATARNSMANQNLYQLGLTVYLVEMACQVTMTALFYSLLKPAGSRLALVAASLALTGCVIKTVARVFYAAPLLILGGGSTLAVFSAGQLQALALLMLRINDMAAGIALVFFGLSTALNGILIVRSTFLPRLLGIVSVVAGLGWLLFIYPPLGDALFSPILLLGLVGGLLQIGWLLIKGVDAERWNRAAQEVNGL